MPFGLLPTPSLALGLLHASLAGLPLRARQSQFSLRFAKAVGFEIYRTVSERWEIGDWVFTEAAFPESNLDPDGFLAEIVQTPPSEYAPSLAALEPADADRVVAASLDAAREARRAVPEFLAACLGEFERQRPWLVGFSCLFQQRLASLAAARLLKQRLPETMVVFGGPECHGVRGVELLRQVPFVDAVVSGPGEIVWPEIARRIMRGEDLYGLPGVHTTREVASAIADVDASAPSPANLDDLPYPLFDDYFTELEAIALEMPISVYLSLETSRGCWWGQRPRRHCTFCGLNGPDLAYHAKSSRRAVEEIEFFARAHPGRTLVMTDSILSQEYLDDVLPALAGKGLSLAVQYEMRATHTREELALLRSAGVVQIQPGIESLSTPLLKLMRKGTTALDNIQLLKWAKELDLTVLWNLLAGLPDEPREAYQEMERLIPLLSHLPPPERFRYVSLVRHSPLFEQAVASGASSVRPARAYSYIFPFAPDVLMNLATTFTRVDCLHASIDEYTQGVQRCVAEWRRTSRSSELLVVENDGSSLVVDRRPGAPQTVIVLDGLEHALHAACDTIQNVQALERRAADGGWTGATRDDVDQVMDGLVARGLVIREGHRYLSLALRALTPGGDGSDGNPRE